MAKTSCTFKYPSSNLPLPDISLQTLGYTCLGAGFSAWFEEDPYFSKTFTPSYFLFQQKILRHLSLYCFEHSYALLWNGFHYDAWCFSNSTPKNIRQLFAHSSDVHAHSTSFSSARNFIFTEESRLGVKLKSFSAFGARLWTCLSPNWCKLTKRVLWKRFATDSW